jgi:hypothetical protein
VIRLWESAWEQFIPFLDYDLEIRTVICSTNAIESLNARYRRAVKARGHFLSVTCLAVAEPTLRGRGGNSGGGHREYLRENASAENYGRARASP